MLEQTLMSLGILFFFAIIGSFIASKLKQPAVIGLLLIGAIIGPNALNLVNDIKIIDMISELGAILLLFVIGLEFVLPKLAKIGFKAVMLGVLKIGITLFIIYETVLLIGISPKVALVLGVMLSMSSTVIIVKILESKGLYNRQEMPLLIGCLIIEDLFAVIVLTFLGSAGNSANILMIFQKIIFAMTIMVLTYIIMLKVMPKILSILTEDSNEEMTTFIALGICAIFSYLSYYLGLSPATGAFIAGSMVASLPQVKIIEHAIKPYTLTFSALFFIAIGSMVDFSAIFDHFGLILVLCLAILISPFIAVGTVSYLFANFKRQQVIFSSMAMMCVGEFSLLIAKMAGGLNLGIDLVSIGAFIIFITAIIMSLSINYYEKVTDILVTTPISYNHKPRSFSNFMRYLTEEIDTDNTHSNTFKKLLVQTLINILFVSFVIIVWSEILGLIDPLPIARLAVHLVFSLIILIQLGMIYYKSRKMYKTLITIITNIYMTGNDKNSKVVLNNLMLALVLLLLTIFSPVFIVLFKLPAGINFISLFLLILVLLRFKRLFNIVHHTSYKGHLFPRYKKVSDLKFDFHRA